MGVAALPAIFGNSVSPPMCFKTFRCRSAFACVKYFFVLLRQLFHVVVEWGLELEPPSHLPRTVQDYMERIRKRKQTQLLNSTVFFTDAIEAAVIAAWA